MIADEQRISVELQSVTLCLLGLIINVKSDKPTIIELVKFDFDFYEVESSNTTHGTSYLNIHVNNSLPDLDIFGPEHSRGKGWVQYRSHEQILIDYEHGKASCIFSKNFESTVNFYGDDLDFLYEKIYLFIMSRLGEYLEDNHLARIHGFALSNMHGHAIIGLAPSGGGKSTIASVLLNHNKTLSLLSDDMPILTKDLRLMPFKHRVSSTQDMSDDNPTLIRTFIRANRANKKVISWKALESRWSLSACEVKFIVSLRFTKTNRPNIDPIGTISTFKLLFRDMVVGYGLPQVVEFFLVDGFISAFKKLPNFTFRLIQAIKLSFHVKACILWQTEDLTANAECLMQWIDGQYNQEISKL